MKKNILLLAAIAILLPIQAQQNILLAPNNTPVLVDDIDRVTYEAGTETADSAEGAPDVLKMYMKDGTVYSRTCGQYGAGISLFSYVPYNNRYTTTTTHQNDYQVEWNVNGVGLTDDCYSVGIWWQKSLSGFENVRSGICFGSSPGLTIEQSDNVQYVDDSSEFPYNRDMHYMFIGSKLSLPATLYDLWGVNYYRFDDEGFYIQIGEDNWLQVPLEYGKTYYYRTFIQGDMMQHGEMKTVTFYDVEKSFRVPKVIDDAGYYGYPIPTEEACQKFGAHFPDSVTAPTREQIKMLWIEWQKTDEAKQIDISADCTPVEFENGTTYDLHRIPDEFYTWLIHREVVIDVWNGIFEISKYQYGDGSVYDTVTPQLVSDVDESWGVPGNRYVRFNPYIPTTNNSVTYRSKEVIPGIRYKLQITFAPETDDEYNKKPTRVSIATLPMGDTYDNYSTDIHRIFNDVEISATEVTTLEVEDVTTTMGIDLRIVTHVSAAQVRRTHNREMRIADIRFVPMTQE